MPRGEAGPPAVAMRTYYCPWKHALVFLGRKADAGFWDAHWSLDAHQLQERLNKVNRTEVTDLTRRYLQPAAGPILEGGCGNGLHVAALSYLGYTAIGIDTAAQTVALVKSLRPDLDVRTGDVRFIGLPNGSLAGYWSLGVIEHAWGGYEAIVVEAHRILRRGGFFFLSFPSLSPLRMLKIALGCYPIIGPEEKEPGDFYQYALSQKLVLETLRQTGFRLIRERRQSGLKGLKDEVRPLRGLLQPLYDYRGGNPFLRVLQFAGEGFSIATGHTTTMVLQKL